MAQRCSFCGSWQDSSAGRCSACDERLGRTAGVTKRLLRLALILVGSVLIGVNLMSVVQSLVNSRAAADPSAIATFAIGALVLIVGFGWRQP